MIAIFCAPTPNMVSGSGDDYPILYLIADDGTGTNLGISWDGAAPDHWAVEKSVDGGLNWAFEAAPVDPAGNIYSDAFYVGTLIRVYGADAGGLPVTDPSNAYEFTVPAPVNALTDDDGNILTDDDGNILTL